MIKDWLNDLSTLVKHVFDGTAITIAVAAYLQYIPSVAATLSAIWLLIQIYDRITKGKK